MNLSMLTKDEGDLRFGRGQEVTLIRAYPKIFSVVETSLGEKALPCLVMYLVTYG